MIEQVKLDIYIDIAIGQAQIERLGSGEWLAEIPQLPGVMATGDTFNACFDQLKEVIEGWIEVRQRRSLSIPSLTLSSAVVGLG